MWGYIMLALLCILSGSVMAQDLDSWTIIYYAAADNDLEGFIIGDLMEMQLVGSQNGVNIVVEMDRHPEYDSINGDWTDTRRYYLQPAQPNALSSGDFQIDPDGFLEQIRAIDFEALGISEEEINAEIDRFLSLSRADFEAEVLFNFGNPLFNGNVPVGLQQEAIASIGETNSGDPNDLADFAIWAIENYPAERYALIITDHGGGWTAIAIDETSGGDGLTMTELDSALARITSETGVDKLDLVAFDACLMAQIEVFKTIAPYAHYTLASEEVIPGAGYEYVVPLMALAENQSLTAPEWGQIIVDAYIDYYTNVLQGYSAFDLHVVDLSKVDQVTSALDNFTNVVAMNREENLKAIGNARNNAQIFGADDPSGADYYSSVDLADFMRLLAKLTTDSAVQDAAEAVITAVDDLIVYGRASDALPGANGVAIYFPANPTVYNLGGNKDNYLRQVAPSMKSWQTFLDIFHGAAVEVFTPEALSINISQVLPSDATASIYDPPVILFQTDGAGIVDLQFYAALQLEDGFQIILDQSQLVFSVFTPDGEEITAYPEGFSENEFRWNVEMPLISDGKNEVETLLINVPGSDEVIVEGLYIWRDGREADAYLVFDTASRTFQSAWGVEQAEEGQATSEVRPQRGDRFEPYWQFLNEAGELEYYLSGTQLVFGDEPFTFEYIPALTGDYELTMWVQDMAGNISVDSITFAIDNEGLDTSYRGFKDVGYGFNFLFPWNWSDPSVIENEDGSFTLTTSDPNGEFYIIVDTYVVENVDDIAATALDNLESFGADYSEPEPYDLGDASAVLIPYSYEGDDGPRVGMQVAIYAPINGYGYIFDFDAPQTMADQLEDVLTLLLDSIVFFEPID